MGGTSPSSLRRGVLDLWHSALCQTSVEDFGLDFPRRRARAEAATGPRLGARGLWLMALKGKKFWSALMEVMEVESGGGVKR